MNSEYDNWLAGLKIGDKVAILRGFRLETEDEKTVVDRATIERFTATQLVVTGEYGATTRFSRNDGFERGSRRASSTDRPLQIAPITQAHHDEFERRSLVERLKIWHWREVPLGKLRRIMATLTMEETNG